MKIVRRFNGNGFSRLIKAWFLPKGLTIAIFSLALLGLLSSQKLNARIPAKQLSGKKIYQTETSLHVKKQGKATILKKLMERLFSPKKVSQAIWEGDSSFIDICWPKEYEEAFMTIMENDLVRAPYEIEYGEEGHVECVLGAYEKYDPEELFPLDEEGEVAERAFQIRDEINQMCAQKIRDEE